MDSRLRGLAEQLDAGLDRPPSVPPDGGPRDRRRRRGPHRAAVDGLGTAEDQAARLALQELRDRRQRHRGAGPGPPRLGFRGGAPTARMTGDVLVEREGPIALLTFNRPDARNAMTFEMYEALTTRA